MRLYSTLFRLVVLLCLVLVALENAGWKWDRKH